MSRYSLFLIGFTIFYTGFCAWIVYGATPIDRYSWDYSEHQCFIDNLAITEFEYKYFLNLLPGQIAFCRPVLKLNILEADQVYIDELFATGTPEL